MYKVLMAAIILGLTISSCVKENTPTTPLNDQVDTTKASPINNGVFMNGPYGRVSGRSTIYIKDGRFILALQDMMITNGPDLHVYLSQEIQPANFIDLGSLQSIKGNQLYDIPGRPDFSLYRYALIHCKKYNHLFGSAKLQ
jgi:hypothetical protein